MPPFKQNFNVFYQLEHRIGSIKVDIALNLSLANIPFTVFITLPLIFLIPKYVIKK